MTRKLSTLVFGLVAVVTGAAVWIHAQAPVSFEGTWEGTLAAPAAKLRLVMEISKAPDGIYLGTLVSVDQGGVRIPVNRIEVTGSTIRLDVAAVNGTFEGLMNSAQTQIKGTWTQGSPLPLEFTRVAAAAEAPKPKPSAGVRNPLGLPLDMEVPASPAPFVGGGRTHLVYELHMTNFSPGELTLTRIEVLSGDAALASFEGAELNTLLMRPGTINLTDKRTLGPGLRAIGCLWITLPESGRVPVSLRHRITAGAGTVEGGPIHVSTAKTIVLGAPLGGSGWLAGNGPSAASIHRTALIPVDGKAHIAQRFAIDWVQMGSDRKTFTGDPKDNKSYHAYGKEALAVADAVVVAAKDGIPENVPGPNSRAVPITLETIGGNHLILDLGGGRFAFYAHLQPGSLRVKIGDRVRQGQALALVGNSGNSTEPHLHFQVSDGNSPLASEGLPYALDSFELLSGTKPGPRRNELPLQNDRIAFSK